MSRLGHIARAGYSPIGVGPDLYLWCRHVFARTCVRIFTSVVYIQSFDLPVSVGSSFSVLATDIHIISIETVKLASSQHRFYFDVHKVCGKLGRGKSALVWW